MTYTLIAPSACNIQGSKTTNPAVIGAVSTTLHSGRLHPVWEHFLHVAYQPMCLCLSTERNWKCGTLETGVQWDFSSAGCLYVHVWVSLSVRWAGKWRLVSKLTTVHMQMEFPADYAEVKQAGPGERGKTTPVPNVVLWWSSPNEGREGEQQKAPRHVQFIKKKSDCGRTHGAQTDRQKQENQTEL